MSDQRIASNDPTVWTYDWVPEGPRGHVRDIRLRLPKTPERSHGGFLI